MSVNDKVIRAPKLTAFLFLPHLLLTVPAGALAVRLYATLEGVFQSPLESVKAIPRNWYRQVLCLDMAHPPELVPGVEKLNRDFTFTRMVSNFSAQLALRSKERWKIWVGGPILFLIAFGPPIVFRLSFKATSFAWLPLLWIVSPLQPTSLSGRDKLEDLREGILSRLVVGWSVVMIGAFAVTLVFGAVLNWLSGDVIKQVFPWQFAAAVNGVLAIGLFIFADEQLRRHKRNQALANQTLSRIITAWIMTRRVLALYTLICALPLVLAWARLMKNVDLEWRLFPQGLFF